MAGDRVPGGQEQVLIAQSAQVHQRVWTSWPRHGRQDDEADPSYHLVEAAMFVTRSVTNIGIGYISRSMPGAATDLKGVHPVKNARG